MRVHVDLDRCEAHGLRVLAAPEVFEFDENRQLHYEDAPGEELSADVEDAARNCPVGAITIARTRSDTEDASQ